MAPTNFEIETKLGFELEAANSFVCNEGNLDALPNPKGKLIYVFKRVSNNGVVTLERDSTLELSQTNPTLKATAERKGFNSRFDLEFIYGGSGGEVWNPTDGKVDKAAFEIAKYIVHWGRIKNKNQQTNYRMQPGPNPGEEDGIAPNPPVNARYQVSAISEDPEFLVHMTVGIPLAGFYVILEDENFRKEFFKEAIPGDRAFTTTAFTKWMGDQGSNLWKSSCNAEYGKKTALGFLFMVQAYVAVAKPEPETENSLKIQVPFMPRTNFRTMLRLVCDTMVPDAAKIFRENLFNFFQTPHSGGIAVQHWSWSTSTPPTTAPSTAASTRPDMSNVFAKIRQTSAGETPAQAPVARQIISTAPTVNCLKVGDFLNDLKRDVADPDLLAQYDRMHRNSQIGGLGNKVERALSSTSDALIGPIVEFRSLQRMKLAHLTDQLRDMQAEGWNGAYHRQAKSQLQLLAEEMKKVHDEVIKMQAKH